MSGIKKRIVFFLDFADSFDNADRVGSVTRIIKYFNALAEYYEIFVLSPDITDYSSRYYCAFRHIPLSKLGQINRHIVYLLLSPLLISRILKSSDLYWGKFSSAIPSIIAKKVFSKPLINLFDYNWVELSRESNESKLEFIVKSRIEKMMIKHSDYFIATTDRLKNYLYFNGFKHSDRIFVIPNYVDTDLFSPCTISGDRSIFRILGVGRLTEQKNFSLLIEGVSKINNIFDQNIEITIVGNGPCKEKLLHQAKELNLRFRIIERVSNNEMPSLYNKHSVFVMTSPREGHPRALIEAMACGLPVIGTDVEGIRDIITDGINGLLCKEDSTDIADKISLIMSDGELSSRLGECARNHALMEYSFKALIEKEVSILNLILS